jgi:hypothetical protein
MSAMLPTMALCRLYMLRPALLWLVWLWTDWLPVDPVVAGVWTCACAWERGAPGVMGDTGLPSVVDTNAAEGDWVKDWADEEEEEEEEEEAWVGVGSPDAVRYEA